METGTQVGDLICEQDKIILSFRRNQIKNFLLSVVIKMKVSCLSISLFHP